MARSAASCSVSCASYFAASRKVLHKSALTDEAASFHSAMKHYSVALHNMKHFAYAPYDEKMEKESFSVCNAILSALYYSAIVSKVV